VGDLEDRPNVTNPARELQGRCSRSGGPGGQGVDTSDSRVELSWALGASSGLPPPLTERALSRLAHRPVGTTLTVVASFASTRPGTWAPRRPFPRPSRNGRCPASPTGWSAPHWPWSPPWTQPVFATPVVCSESSWSLRASAGVFHPSVLRGRLLRTRATASRS